MNIERNRKFLEDMKELRKSILYERLIFFPIKLGLAYFVYSHFETGIFWILAYLIYCVGDTAKILFVNIRELQALIEKYDADLNERVIHPTYHLKKHEVEKLFNACEAAYSLGCPLNRFFTINFDKYAGKKRPQDFTNKLLEHSRKWLQRNGHPVAYLYTLENSPIIGLHMHLLIHIPAHYQVKYKQALTRWLPFKSSSEHMKSKTVQYPTYGDLSPLNDIHGLMQYICKGVEPAQTIFDITPEYQGQVFGQRWGISKLLRNAKPAY